jgi:lipopolysaccharide transport system ATP-binding protein
MHPIIKVENLGKRYNIGRRQSYRTLRESVIETVAAPVRGIAGLLSRNGYEKRDRSDPHVWALRDLSFEVAPGEVLGIIGRNGSGKSTLLKILSRITEPTTGRVELYGRVGSLLEVGTGFHPELTGRENIYLSGAILGMRRAEITRKFDEMVAFAEIDQFVDTPVKHYSSGMYVRLAFAVAAHLEPEILLVDEVLAVGDAAFQKKCLGKIGEVAKLGRTVLFVSHNLATIESLCGTAILLSEGRLCARGTPAVAIAEYTRSVFEADDGRANLANHSGRQPGLRVVMRGVEVCDEAGVAGSIRMGSTVSIRVKFEAPWPIRPCLGLTIKTERGFRVFHVSDRFASQLASRLPVTSGVVTCEIPQIPLMPGRYVVDLWLEDFANQTPLDMVADAVTFEVIPADLLGTGRLPSPNEGPVFYRARWSLAAPDALDTSAGDGATAEVDLVDIKRNG